MTQENRVLQCETAFGFLLDSRTLSFRLRPWTKPMAHPLSAFHASFYLSHGETPRNSPEPVDTLLDTMKPSRPFIIARLRDNICLE